MRRLASIALAGAAALSTTLLHQSDARACGGCFVGPTESTIVTDHRMAFAISKTQTVLWDQIRYNGDPSSFAWVLPVRDGARVELSSDDWFAALDASSLPVVQAPQRTCGGGGIGCGANASQVYSASSAGGGGGVEVVRQEVVGPYETVTLRATDPTALQTWLDRNGFTVPEVVRPTIAAYVAERFDFVALRLQPGKGVRAMQPVRIVTPGADPTLPLRMVAAGVGAQVGITLYVIGEGRYTTANFPEVPIDLGALTWDHVTNSSNYQPLSFAAMAENGGKSWIAEYAMQPQTKYAGMFDPDQPSNFMGGSFTPGLADVYLARCKKGAGDAGRDAPTDIADAAADGDAAVRADAGSFGDPCAAFDDLDVALRGMTERDVWLTRLRANLPAAALNGDLKLGAAAKQEMQTNVHTARRFVDPDYSDCDEDPDGCSASPRARVGAGSVVLVALVGLGLAVMWRRRRRS